MKCRKSVSQLSPAEKTAFRGALLALKAAPSLIPAAQTAVTAGGGTPNRYDDYVWIHSVIGSGAHRGPAFGPWHRELLRQFEMDLRQAAGNPDICIPYWDWTVDRTSAAAGWPFTNDFIGGFGDAVSGQISTSPFADSSQWRINIGGGDPSLVLKRSRGGPGLVEAPPPTGTFTINLPTRTTALPSFGIGVYDVAPFHSDPGTLTPAQRTAQANASFRKYLEWLLHDSTHVWVGGLWNFDAAGNPQNGGHMSFPPVAVNDPIFWLHHCNVDRLWTIWQQTNPGLAYAPTSGANAGHNLNDIMQRFGTATHFNFPVEARPSDVTNYHGDEVWYASDLPEIAPISGSVSFGDVPELLTTYKPIQFSVRTCQRVKFRVTALSGANFSDPLAPGGVTIVDHSDALDPVIGDVYIQFQALGPGNISQPGSATIEAVIDDADGYFAPAVGGAHIVGSWTVTLSATPIPRPRTAIALALDRSGSMGWSAGALGTRYDLLLSALQVVSDIMRDTDGVALVCYDELVTTIAPVTQMGTLTPAGPGRAAITAAISGPDLVPRGNTAIGQGMIAAAAALDAERTSAGTGYSHFALVVMTDGNENVHPYVTAAPVSTAIAPYSTSVYAVGLGPGNGVSASTLGAIANYMLITGNISTSEQRFRLTKYFVQVLAGITRTAIVVDPQGELLLGPEHRIPFQLSQSDVSVDVIVLCPLAFLLEIRLEAPDGTVIERTTASPNLTYHAGGEDAFYRILLPAVPGQAAGTHAGKWTAVISIARRSIRELMKQVDAQSVDLSKLGNMPALPYSLVVQAYSNLMLDVQVNQNSSSPGETLQLLARLTEYQMPLATRATVQVEVTDPAGMVTHVPLTETQTGTYGGDYTTSFSGVYQLRFRASGVTTRGQRMQREETRTAAVFRQPPRGDQGDSGRVEELLDRDRAALCELLRCLLQQEGAKELLAKLGVERDFVAKCLARYCRQPGKK